MNFILKKYFNFILNEQEILSQNMDFNIKRGIFNIQRNGDIIIVARMLSRLESRNEIQDIKKIILEILQNLSCISRIDIFKDDTFRIFLNRSLILQSTLSKPFNCEEWFKSQNKEKYKDVLLYIPKNDCTITESRCCVVGNHIAKLYEIIGLNVHIMSYNRECQNIKDSHMETKSKLKFVFTSSDSIVEDNKLVVLCSAVVDQNTGLKMKISLGEYLDHLQKELYKSSKHKQNNMKKDFLQNFLVTQSKNCHILKMLLVTHLSTVKVDYKIDSQNSRASAFILYNYARICMLMKNLQNFIDGNILPQMPSVEKVDFSLLKHQEEWELCWMFVHRFPELLNEIIEDLFQNPHNEQNGSSEEATRTLDKTNVKKIRHYPTHKISQFLQSLSHCLSTYYNRIHILPPIGAHGNKNFAHLLPVLWARIYLLKSIQSVMSICFSTMDIIPPSIF